MKNLFRNLGLIRQGSRITASIPVKRKNAGFVWACAILSILVLVDMLFIVPLFQEIHEVENAIRAKQELAGRLETKVMETESALNGLQNKVQQAQSISLFISEANVESLATNLDMSLSRIAPGKLQKIRYTPRQNEQVGDVTLAIFEYEMAADIYGIAALVDGLRDFETPLLIRELRIKSSPNRALPLNVQMQLGAIIRLQKKNP